MYVNGPLQSIEKSHYQLSGFTNEQLEGYTEALEKASEILDTVYQMIDNTQKLKRLTGRKKQITKQIQQLTEQDKEYTPPASVLVERHRAFREDSTMYFYFTAHNMLSGKHGCGKTPREAVASVL